MGLKVIPNELFFLSIEDVIKSGGSVELKVKGSSMHPTLLNGKHKVVLVPFEQRYLRVGMIALFVYNDKHILHRLVALNADSLVFQGDNLPFSKEKVKVGEIKAFVEYIITPHGKIIDCKKWRYVVLSRLFVSINKLRFIALKIKYKMGYLIRKRKLKVRNKKLEVRNKKLEVRNKK